MNPALFNEYIEKRYDLSREYADLAKRMETHRKGKAYNRTASGAWTTATGASSATAAVLLPFGFVAAPVAVIAGAASIVLGAFTIGRTIISSTAFYADSEHIKKRIATLKESVSYIAEIDSIINKKMNANVHIDSVSNALGSLQNMKGIYDMPCDVISKATGINLAKDICNMPGDVGSGLQVVKFLDASGTDALNKTISEGLPMVGIAAGSDAAATLASSLGGLGAAYGVYGIYKGVQDWNKPSSDMVIAMKLTSEKIKEETDAIKGLGEDLCKEH